ncbi:MAG: PQQ-binding-like beta-propeller repeat protein [Candidatus Anammoximicrobium sp.]|nr:PQQ-binding-like beta-propeller repeat protein [Candidatus Anammoximicrobium sp.]
MVRSSAAGVLLAALVLLLAVGGHAAAQPLGWWTFDANQVKGVTVVDRAGNHDGSIQGEIRLTQGPFAALALDGEANSVDVPNVQAADLPARELSIEAWVSLDAGLAWGGIAGYFQDNGSFEKGWLLGYDETHFSFAVSASGRLTYLKGATPFQEGQWYHVAGTYDGQAMKLYVNGKLEATATNQRGDIDYPPTALLTIGAYRDDNEFYRAQGRIQEVVLHGRVLEPAEIESRFAATETQIPRPLAFRVPPCARFIAPDAVVVAWETDEPCESIVEYGLEEKWDRQARDAALKTSHRITLAGLEPKARCQYRIRANQPGRPASISEVFELDNALNYTVARVPDLPSPYASDERGQRCRQAAQEILSATRITRGYCLVLGCHDGQLAYELVRRSDLIVVGVDNDCNRIERARAALGKAAAYGSRITLHHAAAADRLPFPQSFANLIVAEDGIVSGELPATASQVIPLLQPAGGVACLGPLRAASSADAKGRVEDWLGKTKAHWDFVETSLGGWVVARRELPPGTGAWTHQYGDAGNSANGQEDLQGVTSTDRLEVQWLGRPGGDFGLDRNPRMPAPLAIHGRLFHQGMNRIAALDSYNGAVLWSLEIPALRRVNMPRDAGNWCADPHHLYVAIKDRCWVISAQTGEVIRTLSLADAGLRATHEWGYVAQAGKFLYGSSVRKGAPYTDFWGGKSWYDATSGAGTEKVCSDDLFALAGTSGELKWRYRGGVILNTTIAVAGGKVLFVECRHPEVKTLATSRIGSPQLWEDQFLVALDAATGRKLWEQPLDTVDGIVVFYLLAAADRVFIASSEAGQYHLYAFSAADGNSLWHTAHDWIRNNHGGHMQHPVLVGNAVYLEPCGYDAATGKLLTKNVGRHGGCATYAATTSALIYRGEAGRISMWDVASEKVTGWYNLRPSCWLSTVPANGMVLSPEGGGGCSCGNWLETSIGFAPAPSSAAK